MLSTEEVVDEVMRLHRSLPARPGVEEVEAAREFLAAVEREDLQKLDSIARQRRGKDVPEELFNVLQEMQRAMVDLQSKEQKKEALRVLGLEHAHYVFDDLVQRASKCLPPATHSYAPSTSSSLNSSSLSSLATLASMSSSSFGSPATTTTVPPPLSGYYSYPEHLMKTSEFHSKDDSFLKKSKTAFHMNGIGAVGRRPDYTPAASMILDSSLKPATNPSGDGEKLSLIKLASFIELTAKRGTQDHLILKNKLSDQVDWLPQSIGKLTSLITLDLSENRIASLPSSIGGLSSLKKLDLHSNRITDLPDTIGNLLTLVYLDLSGNQLKSLPVSMCKLSRLEELDLSSNALSNLPETIGSLSSLRRLIVETNDLEELPHTISQCSSLAELRADYNKLKALPEAVGRMGALEILSVRYNNVRQLPTTMASMGSLKELNVSFNEIESVPESLCLVTTLVKLNISNNFADLRCLPRSIGNLEMLEELDMSNNQIRNLPDSFRMLSKLRVLKTEGNPLEFPPRNIVEMGAQAVVEYMGDVCAKRDVKSQPVKQKKWSWTQRCFPSRSNKRKRNVEYVKTR